MAPPDGSRSTRLPTLSWNSVVEDAPPVDAPSVETPSVETPSVESPSVEAPLDTVRFGAEAPAAPPQPGDASPSRPLTPPIVFTSASAPAPAPAPAPPIPAEAPAVADDLMVPIQFAPLTLDTSPILHSPRAASAPRPEPVAAPAPAAPAAPTVAAAPTAEPAPAGSDAAVDESDPSSSPAPVEPVVAAVADPDVEVDNADRVSTELPQIVEATPVPEMLAAPQPTGPRLPHAQAATPAPARAAVYESSAAPTGPVPTQRRRRKARTGLKLLLTLVVLGAVIAAAVVFGRPYLFPGEWDAQTEPFAEAVEVARGVEFVEPITLISEPTADYTARMSTELAGDWTRDQAMWRSLGLLNGDATPASVTQQIAGWQDAIYSTEDGQVYRDEAITGPQADAQIAAAVAEASLDQEFRWSVDQAERRLDAQVLTLAEVRRQSAATVADTQYAVTVDRADPTVLTFVPPVVAYRLLAPAVYAEFDNPTGSLSGIGAGGPGPLETPAPVVAPDPEPIGTDTLVSSPQPADRSFWYLVLGGFLDPRTAYVASESIVENSVSMAEREGTACVYSTFAGGDVAQTATLRSALEAWAAAAPTEFGSSAGVLPDGTLQLVSCDPGAGFEHPNRLGVARELIGWRTAELATIEAVTAAFGAGADATEAWAIVEASDIGTDLASLPGGTAPAETAAAARAAITALFTPADG